MNDNPKDKGSWLGPNPDQQHPANIPGFDTEYLLKKKPSGQIDSQQEPSVETTEPEKDLGQNTTQDPS